jgi:hypothetical protein
MKITFEDETTKVTIEQEDPDLECLVEMIKTCLIGITYHPNTVNQIFADD